MVILWNFSMTQAAVLSGSCCLTRCGTSPPHRHRFFEDVADIRAQERARNDSKRMEILERRRKQMDEVAEKKRGSSSWGGETCAVIDEPMPDGQQNVCVECEHELHMSNSTVHSSCLCHRQRNVKQQLCSLWSSVVLMHHDFWVKLYFVYVLRREL